MHAAQLLWKVTLPPSLKTLLLLTVGMLTCATKCAVQCSAVQCSTHYLFMGNILLYVTMYCSAKLSLLFVYTIWIVRFSLDRLHFKKLNIPCDYVFSVVRDLARGKHVYIREKKKKKSLLAKFTWIRVHLWSHIPLSIIFDWFGQ